MREFVCGELWGPFRCEIKRCHKWTHTIVLSDKENKLLPEQSGPKAVSFIFDEKLGIAKCEHCLRKKK